MPLITSPLQADGALVDIEVGWSNARAKKLRRALRPVPPPMFVSALIDTGAEITCVNSSVIHQLGLPFGGSALANVPAQSGLTVSWMHDVSLSVLHPSGDPAKHLKMANLTVLEIALHTLGYLVLVGRDILSICRLLYDGQRNRFLLKYS